MVTYAELINLANKSKGNYDLSEEELISFVKDGAVRAYKAADAARHGENIGADFNAETKELQLSVKKTVVETVKDAHTECNQAEGNQSIGNTVTTPIEDAETYRAIDAAIKILQRLIEAGWKKENSDLVKIRYQEFKNHCLQAKVIDEKSYPAIVSIGAVEASLPVDEQLPTELLQVNQEILVYVKDLKEFENSNEIIVSRTHPQLVSHLVRQLIPEVDLGNIEIKAVSRIPGRQSRVAVVSKDMGAVERCEAKAYRVSEALAGEKIDFIEWYADTKAYIASALKQECKDVHIIESEKQAIAEVFADAKNSSEVNEDDGITLARELTGYNIKLKIVSKDSDSELPGV